MYKVEAYWSRIITKGQEPKYKEFIKEIEDIEEAKAYADLTVKNYADEPSWKVDVKNKDTKEIVYEVATISYKEWLAKQSKTEEVVEKKKEEEKNV